LQERFDVSQASFLLQNRDKSCMKTENKMCNIRPASVCVSKSDYKWDSSPCPHQLEMCSGIEVALHLIIRWYEPIGDVKSFHYRK